jgi:glycosyltransferase involved in cell wall biosynthesis
MKLSLILCTHNPRRDYLERVLAALRAQTLPPSEWEFIIVDNRSEPPLASWLRLDGLPHARMIGETETGFTPALLAGADAAGTDVCVLLHDDNVLDSDYLEHADRLAREWRMLGAWGGHYRPEYEEPPAPELAPFLRYLAVNPVEADCWSNALYDYRAAPCGAGMVVRTPVLRRYAKSTRADSQRRSLGRHSQRITSCEDFDIAFTAIDLGLGMGVFTCLRVLHLIPRQRVQRDYLLRLVEGHSYSMVLLHSFRGPVPPLPRGLLSRLRAWRYRRRLGPVERTIHCATVSGQRRAYATLRALGRLPA